jgi:hypothetical protein
MMAKKKKGYGVLMGLTVILTALAVVTVIPNPNASKACGLGYKALCAFVPWATIILLLAAGAVCVIRKKLFTEKG